MFSLPKTIITVDPGTAGLGIAVWDRVEWEVVYSLNIKQKRELLQTLTPIKHFTKTFKEKEKYFHWFDELLITYNCSIVYCEKPAYMGSSDKGQMVAESGRLVTLALHVGGLRAIAWTRACSFHLIDVATWKGTLSKAIVQERILRVWPECQAKSHDWDAIGIGMYLLGLINNSKRKDFHHE